MKKLIMAVILIIALFSTMSAYADGSIYSKPEFRGRVIDAETKQPIEGAVVVVLYYKRPIISGPGGPSAYAFKAKETLTDNKGEFYFSAYSSLILFTEDAGVNFIFFKPGYMSGYGPTNINPNLIEKYFATNTIGKEAEIKTGTYEQGSYVTWKGPLGILELEKAKTREERRKTRPSSGGLEANQLPIFFKILEEEYQHLYK